MTGFLSGQNCLDLGLTNDLLTTIISWVRREKVWSPGFNVKTTVLSGATCLVSNGNSISICVSPAMKACQILKRDKQSRPVLVQYQSNVSWQSLETRTTRLEPRSSKLENFEYRVSSRVVRVSSRVVRVSSRGEKELIARLYFFPNTCTGQSYWFTLGDREIFESWI